MNSDAAKKIRNSVCAVGYLTVPMEQHKINPTNPDFFIIGTGFLVSENLIITNRHVLEGLYKLEDKGTIPKEQFLVSFVYPQKDNKPNWQLCYTGITKSFIPNEAHMPDIGFIEFSRKKTLEDFKQCKPVIFDDLSGVNVGDPVAMWGYPTGTALLQPDLIYSQNQKLCRVGPVLQQGYISAGTPFEVESGTLEFLLDIRTYNGMSGSPVFNPNTGKILGIHYKGNKLTTSVAIALSNKDIEFWLSKLIDEDF
ncbi:trypsin-like peptidase domain-containing protein [bacterium]|nr:trypsin-like peptidase domain-containing protein [bacterium]